jgi:hypothetical protein
MPVRRADDEGRSRRPAAYRAAPPAVPHGGDDPFPLRTRVPAPSRGRSGSAAFATRRRHCCSRKASRATVQRILRHTDPRLTTEIYGHLDVEDIRAGLDRLRIDTPTTAPSDAIPSCKILATSPRFLPKWCAGGAGQRVIADRRRSRPAETQAESRFELVGETGFEPATPWSRTRCSTRLSHSPTEGRRK